MYAEANCGNVALPGEIDLAVAGHVAANPGEQESPSTEALLVVAFGRDVQEAGHLALHALPKGFDTICQQYCKEWEAWHAHLGPLPAKEGRSAGHMPWRVSTTVLAVHESKILRGGLIAGLALQWGEWCGDDDTDG